MKSIKSQLLSLALASTSMVTADFAQAQRGQMVSSGREVPLALAVSFEDTELGIDVNSKYATQSVFEYFRTKNQVKGVFEYEPLLDDSITLCAEFTNRKAFNLARNQIARIVWAGRSEFGQHSSYKTVYRCSPRPAVEATPEKGELSSLPDQNTLVCKSHFENRAVTLTLQETIKKSRVLWTYARLSDSVESGSGNRMQRISQYRVNPQGSVSFLSNELKFEIQILEGEIIASTDAYESLSCEIQQQ